MKKFWSVLILLPLAYLLFWPTGLAPKAWDAPIDMGFSGDFAVNTLLSQAKPLTLPAGFSGPEAVLVRHNGDLVTSSYQGAILVKPHGQSEFKVLFETGGRPLGLAETETGDLLIADAYKGLLRYRENQGLEVLVDQYQGQRLGYVNSLAYLPGGWVFFTDSSSKFPAQANGGTYPASLLDIMEHGGHGRLFSYDLQNQVLIEVAHGFNFANGVAAFAGESEGLVSVYVNETGNYRVLEFELLDGVVQSQHTVIDNLPGFPDNLSASPDGNLWLGLVSPRNRLLDKMASKPWLRNVVQRLPGFLRPKATHYGAVVKFSRKGEVLAQWQDPSGTIFTTTGVAEGKDGLYVSRLHGNFVAILPKDLLQKH